MQILCRVLLLLLMSYVGHAQTMSQIIFERTPCMGKCEAYQVKIDSKGEVEYTGKKDVNRIGLHTTKVSAARIKAIFKKYQKRKWFSLPDQYKNKISDISYLHVTVTINRKIKTIRNAHMGPEYIQLICQEIDKLLAEKENVWISPPASPSADIIYTEAEVQPQFPGGIPALRSYIHGNRKFPKEAVTAGKEGKVVVNFVVEKNGSLSNIQIEKGMGNGCDEEAIRVIKSMPAWQPGREQNQPVRVKMSAEVDFYFE